jgi:hypothetical protein
MPKSTERLQQIYEAEPEGFRKSILRLFFIQPSLIGPNIDNLVPVNLNNPDHYSSYRMAIRNDFNYERLGFQQREEGEFILRQAWRIIDGAINDIGEYVPEPRQNNLRY